MQSLEKSDLEKFSDDLNDILDKIPDARRELHEKIAVMAKQEVNTQINVSGIHDSGGRIKEWQEPHVGSGGGYAAVRASGSSSGDNSPGAITNYLENGHKIRRPSGQAKRYRPKIKLPYVDGKHFYQNSKAALESKVIDLAENYADDLLKGLENG